MRWLYPIHLISIQAFVQAIMRFLNLRFVGSLLGLGCLGILLIAYVGCSRGKKEPLRPTIVLFTDFSTHDAALAQIKGAIKTIHPQADIIDISRDVFRADALANAYLLDQTARYFPAGAVFVVALSDPVSTKARPIALMTQAGKIYVGPDSGVFGRVIQREGLQDARVIENQELFFKPSQDMSSTASGIEYYAPIGGYLSKDYPLSAVGPSLLSPGRDIFGPVAAHLADGLRFKHIGPRAANLQPRMLPPNPTVLNKQITGQIIYIDPRGDVITNILSEHLTDFDREQLIRVSYMGHNFALPFVEHPDRAPEGRLFCYLNDNNELQISLPNGSAAALMNARMGQMIIIRY